MMNFMKQCKCGFAAIAVFLFSVLICYINGYTLKNWAATTWMVLIFIALAAGFCLRCRQKEDETNAIQGN